MNAAQRAAIAVMFPGWLEPAPAGDSAACRGEAHGYDGFADDIGCNKAHALVDRAAKVIAERDARITALEAFLDANAWGTHDAGACCIGCGQGWSKPGCPHKPDCALVALLGREPTRP